ncbi:AMP phosphorylase [Candidatus Woesearchaeota archaeon]|nr:AMP phosphorylase [Candidatus Woesearchaeota archaeon]
MKLRAKNLEISTGGPLVVVLNEEDAKKLDLHASDRVKIEKGRKIETAVVDLSRDSPQKGTIGLMNEVSASLGLKNGSLVRIIPARKPVSLEYIKKKLDGKHLNKSEIKQVIWDIVHNKLSDIELTYFISACYCNPNTMEETVCLTRAMATEGQRLRLNRKIIMDKHSIGGIPGNRTTMVIVPIIAAAGYAMPKTSSRAITSPAGTADTMEVLAKVVFPIEEMRDIINKANACIVWGGALNLAPADDKIIKAEKSLMIDAESQLLASIMAKKHSVSSTHVIIDIPIGPNTKITDRIKAIHLKGEFTKLGKNLDMKTRIIITDGRQPIGKGIGPALEARDVLKVLRQDYDRPLDLEKKCIKMAGELFKMVGEKKGAMLAQHILRSGKAYQKMKQIIKLQKGNPNVKPEEIPLARFEYDYIAKRNGKVKNINNILTAKLARIAGAPENRGAGIMLYRQIGDTIKKGKRIFTVYGGSRQKIDFVKQALQDMQDIVVY